MTPSIIRRFARYHGLTLERVDDASVVTEAYGIAPLARYVYSPVPSNWSVFRDACDKIIQALTRIEDAEHCLRRSTVRYFSRTDAEREEAAMIAAELFAIAGIDEVRWREVKDEEA